MERSEPSLVPQWLKSSSSSHLQLASALHSDNHSARLSRNKSSVSSDHDISRTSVSEKTTSAYFHRSSSSNTTNYPPSYSIFSKGHRVREWEKDINGYHDKERHLDYADSLGTTLPIFDKDPLWRSQSLITGKQGDLWPRKVINDSNATKKSNHNSGNAPNGAHTIGAKSTFEDNFPSLAAEERLDGAEIGGVSSPGSNTANESLQGGSSVVTGGDSWTSALVDVPVNMGSSGTGVAATQTVSASSASIVPTKTTTLNMAETVAQGLTRARTPPLLNVGSQKREELAIKQSRQLIPMTPYTPKPLVLSPSEKSKSKIGQHQYSSLPLNNLRGGAGRPDGLKTPNESKLQTLKPSRELNGFPSTARDTLSPTNGSKLAISPISGNPSSTASASFRSSSLSSSPTNVGRNPSSFHVTIEKRTMAQAQSRNDFFNLLKKKSSQNSPSAVSDPGPAVSPSFSEKSDEVTAEDGSTSVPLHSSNVPPSSEISVAGLQTDSRSDVTHNGDSFGGSYQCSSNGEKHPTHHVFLGGEEEETAFLRSLGWDENAGEDEGLTEEEIHSFCEEYMKLRPSAKLSQGMQQKLPLSSVEGSTLDSNSES
ncbi:hypothetical protein SLEP1_g33544 [Rubroshorea leprosula]|uniref:Uncharacterized protein n=1 Tax=Rubroshorea leprosula TaxID=152421 RepID=A0AAV5KGX9_9ROSI|nr:hypothetical protein SLEP1_g33544 [Rubroshorea leprosula]